MRQLFAPSQASNVVGDAIDALSPWLYLHPDDLPATVLANGEAWPNRGSQADWQLAPLGSDGTVADYLGWPSLTVANFGWNDVSSPNYPNATVAFVADMPGINRFDLGPWNFFSTIGVNAVPNYHLQAVDRGVAPAAQTHRLVTALRQGTAASGIWEDGVKVATLNSINMTGSQGWRRVQARPLTSLMIFPPETDPADVVAAVEEVFS